MHRTWSHPRRTHRGRPLLGVFVLFWGVVLLLRALNIPGLDDLHRWFWPAALIGGGLSALVFGRGGERVVGGFLLAVGLPILANRYFGWALHLGALIWPAMLIYFGVNLLFRRPRRDMGQVRVNIDTVPDGWPRAGGPASGDTAPGTATPEAGPAAPVEDEAPGNADTAGRVREFAFLGGIERNNSSQAFRGGDITATLGGVQLDLRDCRMAPEGARLDVLAFMGGVSLRIPKDWCVVSEVSVVLGGMDDRSIAPVDASAPRLLITGQAIMGGIEIKN